MNFPKLMGGGVLHTKLWIVDEQHFYVGSANMDWRSLTEVRKCRYHNCDTVIFKKNTHTHVTVYFTILTRKSGKVIL